LGRLAAQENTGDHGSSRTYAPYVITPLAGVQSYLGAGAQVFHCDETQLLEARQLAAEVDCVIIVAGYDFNDEGEFVSPGGMGDFISPVITGYKNMGQPIKAAILKLLASSLSRQLQSNQGSPLGGDRQSLGLKPEQVELIQAVGAVNPNTVVVLVCGSMVMLEEWAEQVPAVIYSWYAGMEGGNALARILFGDVNPSGRLPFTIPTDPAHLPYFSSTDAEINYDLYHGYTLLDKNGWEPAYPFGYGLSYTTFHHHDLEVKLADQHLEVKVKVTNTGNRAGEEVVQVYVGMENSKIERQKKLLKGFEKVFVRAGETVSVTITIAIDELRYYSLEEKSWLLEPGTYVILAGANSAESALLKARINLSHVSV
jgi:beta-glucosidase